jgi:hypothetical protein
MQTVSRRDRVIDPVHGHWVVWEIIPSRRRGLEGGNAAEVIVDFDDGTRRASIFCLVDNS